MKAVLLDYEGDPCFIEDGEVYEVWLEKGEHWNPQTQEIEPDEPEFTGDPYPDDRKAMGMSWWDCNDRREFT